MYGLLGNILLLKSNVFQENNSFFTVVYKDSYVILICGFDQNENNIGVTFLSKWSFIWL